VLAMESNGGFGANSGPSRGDRCRRAFCSIEASKAAVFICPLNVDSGRSMWEPCPGRVETVEALMRE
jgi:hypothetical protein